MAIPAALKLGEPMKRVLLFAASSLAMLASPALAQDSGWYLRGNAGYGLHTDSEFDQSVFRGDIESEGNAALSAGIGYEFDNNWRLELDADTLKTSMGKIGNNPGSKASLRTNTAMLNAIYDFSDFGRWEPYVGAGVGLVQGKLDAVAHDFLNGSASTINPSCLGGQSGNCAVSDKDTGFGWQLLAGLGYDLTDNLTWDTHYSYLNGGPLKVDAAYTPSALSNVGALTHQSKLDSIGAHTLMTGLRYKFGSTPKPSYTCWDGSSVSSLADCPSKPEPKPDYTCWNGDLVFGASECPAKPEPTKTCWNGDVIPQSATCATPPPPPPPAPTFTCWDNTIVSDASQCAPQPVVKPYNDCGPSNVAIFNVPLNKTPKQMPRLGTMPEFGDSHGLTPVQFYEKLKRRYSESKVDRAYLDYLFKSMGYSNGFSDAQEYMFSEDVLPVGTRGMLGLGKQHHYEYSILPSNDRDRQAFRIQSANGSVIHFMKTCGNYMYACNN